jgi:hypothetical protein
MGMINRSALAVASSLSFSPAAFVGAVPPPPEQIVANCSAPTYASDFVVCSDPELLELDHELAKFAEVLAPAGIESHLDWFARRSLCAMRADHKDCLKQMYETRIKLLEDYWNGCPGDGDKPNR